MDCGILTDAIFLDFLKAFDDVPHTRLTLKMTNLDHFPNNITSSLQFFVDDCIIYCGIDIPDNGMLSQFNLNVISNWYSDWLLSLKARLRS